jgi:hypothetical protein
MKNKFEVRIFRKFKFTECHVFEVYANTEKEAKEIIEQNKDKLFYSADEEEYKQINKNIKSYCWDEDAKWNGELIEENESEITLII